MIFGGYDGQLYPGIDVAYDYDGQLYPGIDVAYYYDGQLYPGIYVAEVFPTLVLQFRKNPVKTQPGKLIRTGIEPGPAA